MFKKCIRWILPLVVLLAIIILTLTLMPAILTHAAGTAPYIVWYPH